MTREEIRLQVAVSALQGVLEAKLGVVGEALPSVAVEESLRIADEFVKQWFKDGEVKNIEQEKEQKPAEWSEEDENRFNNLCSVIDESKSWNDVSKQAFKNWLKSIRPQPHWKPSEEQMKALNEVANNGVLLDLFNDLLKLL